MNKIIKFEKKGCAPCQMVQNFLENEGVEFQRVDAFDEAHITGMYDIGSLPTVLLVDEKGYELERSVGFNPDELKAIIDQL